MGALHVERELPDHRYEIYKTAKKFDYATLAFGPVYQLGAALDYLERVGVARIEAHTVGLASELAAGLRSIADRGADAGRQPLVDRGVSQSCRCRRHPRRPRCRPHAGQPAAGRREIRVSPALFNTSDDIRRFLDVAGALKARSRV